MAFEALLAFVSSPWIYVVIVWDAVWRGIALWKSGKNNQLTYFIFF